MAVKRRRLGDLYVLGRELDVNDGSGDPVKVWVSKVNGVDFETMLRKAGAAKSRVLSAKDDEESEEFQAALTDVDEFGERDVLVDYLIGEDLVKARESFEAELAAGSEWAEDGYLQGLQDAWQGEGEDGLKWVYAENNQDPEAARVFNELKRFSDEATAMLDGERERLRRDMEHVDYEDLRRKAVDRFLEARASQVWLREFRRWQVYFAIREPEDHKRRYFASIDEVNELDPRVLGLLIATCEEVEVSLIEGKGLPPTLGSSDSSEPSGEAATDEPSGPLAAAQ